MTLVHAAAFSLLTAALSASARAQPQAQAKPRRWRDPSRRSRELCRRHQQQRRRYADGRRHGYKVVNTDKTSGAVSTDQGKGVNVFHHDADRKWRVAVDSWSSNLPASK